MMPTFNLSAPWHGYLLWNALAFAGACLVNSFVEWGAHRFVLHGTRLGRFAYELHHVGHHGMFGAGETYHALNDEMRSHVTFVLRDYVLFLVVTTPLWMAVEYATGRPLILGGVLATLAGLQMFNSFHWRFHVPTDTWFQRCWFFKTLKEQHRRHHADMTSNFNVYSFPLADWVLGTLQKRRREAPTSTDPAEGSPAGPSPGVAQGRPEP
jgi:hypothetical protein